MKPNLIDKKKLKPKVEKEIIKTYEFPDMDTIVSSIKIPEMDNKSMNIIMNVFIFILLVGISMWLYIIYVDRKDTKITPLLEIESNTYQVPIIARGDPNNLSETVPENIYTNGKNDFTLF